MMQFPVVKCHGSGNDFPLIDARALSLDDAAWGRVARALSDRAGPVGGDGLLLLTAGAADAAFGMRMFNPDGSEAETCLNGLRCIARAGLAATGGTTAQVRLKTSAATVEHAAPLAPGVWTVRETAGPASLLLADWPMRIGRETNVDRPIDALPGARAFTAVLMPNPHLVAFVDAIDEDELVAIGRVCEAAPAWLPNRANVSFVAAQGPNALFVRTFERGAGLTDACGSAMGASIFAAGLTGRIGWDVETVVHNRGGLVRAAAAADGVVTLSGNATWDWRGHVTVDDAGARDLVVDRRFPEEAAAWAAAVAAAR